MERSFLLGCVGGDRDAIIFVRGVSAHAIGGYFDGSKPTAWGNFSWEGVLAGAELVVVLGACILRQQHRLLKLKGEPAVCLVICLFCQKNEGGKDYFIFIISSYLTLTALVVMAHIWATRFY